jgi:hypothetical protein
MFFFLKSDDADGWKERKIKEKNSQDGRKKENKQNQKKKQTQDVDCRPMEKETNINGE